MSAGAGDDAAYRALLADLVGARRRGIRLGLERVRACLDRLGAPDRRFVSAQIGGTNGKGSTAVFAASLARAAGARVGRYTSPHLCRLGERVVVDGAEVSRAELCAAGEATRAAGGDALTFFERITCMALWLFAERGVDVALLEVGLGGRLDATTAAEVEAAVVTGVAFDHQAYLGDRLEDIAAEKGAIFRAGRPAVIGCAGIAAGRDLLERAARAAGAEPIVLVDATRRLPPLGLPGAHQLGNAAAALALCELLAERGHLRLDDEAVARGLAAARLPGRLEELATTPPVVLDVGHNPDAAAALARALPERPLVLVLGLSADKDAAGIAAALAPRACAAVAVAAASDRATPAVAVAGALRAAAPALPVEVAGSVADGVDRARALCPAGGAVLVAGSVFVVGEARAALTGEEVDPMPTSDPVPPPVAPGRSCPR